MAQKIAIIFNQSADREVSADKVRLLKEAAIKRGLETEIYTVHSVEEVVDKAKEAAQAGAEIVAGIGSDATLSAVAAGLIGSRAKLGVIPLGTFNHFAADLGIPADIDGALAVLAGGVSETVDVGEVNRQIFLNNSAIGIYPQIAHEKEEVEHSTHGKLAAFISAAWKILKKYPSLILRTSLDGQKVAHRTSFIFIGNNEYILEGLRMSRREGLRQGFLDIGVAQRAEPFHLLKLFFRVLTGKVEGEPYFDEYHVQEARIDSRQRFLPVSLDGEVKIMRTPLHFKILPRALTVILPKPV